MTMSEAQKRADRNYRKKNVKQFIVRFYPKDADLYTFVKVHGGAVYLRELAQREFNSKQAMDPEC